MPQGGEREPANSSVCFFARPDNITCIKAHDVTRKLRVGLVQDLFCLNIAHGGVPDDLPIPLDCHGQVGSAPLDESYLTYSS